jgi:hypothetical protein
LSWIIRDLWTSLEARESEYRDRLDRDRFQAYGIINRIASEVGARWKIVLQLNFPPGQHGPRVEGLGHRDLSMIVYRDRHRFDHVSEAEVKNAFRPLSPASFDPLRHDYEGFKVSLSSGRIDCLPGAIHLWCEITPLILKVLDWLFPNAYGLDPEEGLARKTSGEFEPVRH